MSAASPVSSLVRSMLLLLPMHQLHVFLHITCWTKPQEYCDSRRPISIECFQLRRESVNGGLDAQPHTQPGRPNRQLAFITESVSLHAADRIFVDRDRDSVG